MARAKTLREAEILQILRREASGLLTQARKTTNLRCYVRPNRRFPRSITAKTAAAFVCRALESGATPAELRFQMAPCLPCSESKRQAQEQQAIAALEASNATLLLVDLVINALGLVTRGLGFITRFVPQARAATLVLVPLEREIRALRSEIVATKAANDAAIRILRLAA